MGVACHGSWAAAGHNPIKEREAEERAARREDITLAILTADAFKARKATLKGDGTAGRWLSPLAGQVSLTPNARHSRAMLRVFVATAFSASSRR